MQLTELAPKLPVARVITFSNKEFIKKKIPLKDDKTTLHEKCYEPFLPNEKSVSYLGKQSTSDYNCQFEKTSPKIRQNQKIHLKELGSDHHLLLLGKVYLPSNWFLFFLRN